MNCGSLLVRKNHRLFHVLIADASFDTSISYLWPEKWPAARLGSRDLDQASRSQIQELPREICPAHIIRKAIPRQLAKQREAVSGQRFPHERRHEVSDRIFLSFD